MLQELKQTYQGKTPSCWFYRINTLLQFHHTQLHMRMTDQKLLMSHQGCDDDRHIIPMDFQSLTVNMSCIVLCFGRLPSHTNGYLHI